MTGRIILCSEIGTDRSSCLVIDPRPPRTGKCDPRCGRYLQPAGYIQAHDWAEVMLRDHDQLQCPGCGRWSIWEPVSVDTERGGAS
jgi:hypothetical protein